MINLSPDIIVALGSAVFLVLGGVMKISYTFGTKRERIDTEPESQNNCPDNGNDRRVVHMDRYKADQELLKVVNKNLKEGQLINRNEIKETQKSVLRMVETNKNDHQGLYEKIDDLQKVLYQEKGKI